ncbi:MAG: RagB/SusD family nutrient uptake outer membrane protein [Bacteroidales bacterium]
MKKYILALGLLVGMNSCDYLDILPDNIATVEIAFNTRTGALKFLTTCYSYVPEYANPVENFALLAADEIWYYTEKDFYMDNKTSFRLAKGMQNAVDPYCNFWEGSQGGYNMWIAIRDCNIFLENIKSVPGLTNVEMARWIGEVKTLKAFYHFWLMRMYGPIPIVAENIPVDASPEQTRVRRESVDNVVNYIVSLLDEVIDSNSLPQSITSASTESGRLTMAACKAIKAKVLVQAASPLFNGNEQYAQFTDKQGIPLINPVYDGNKWGRALEACRQAIDEAESAGHKLFRFTKLLPIGELSEEIKQELTLRATITESFNKEVIWSLGPNYTRALQDWCQPRLTYDHAQSLNSTKKTHVPTLNVVEDFYSNYGIPLKEDKTWDYSMRYQTININDQLARDHIYQIQEGYSTSRLHTYREPRFYAYIGFDGGKWFSMEAENPENIPAVAAKAGQLSGKSGIETYSITGYFTKKVINYENIIKVGNLAIKEYSFPIIRLSDLYLMYAEAANEVNGTPNEDVYEYIQRVRHKAGLDKNSNLQTTWNAYSNNPNKPNTQEGMREIIRQERLNEFVFEGQRFWDLRRWRLAQEYLSKPIQGWTVFESSASNFYQVQNIYYRDYLQKSYLWPISQTEMLKNSNLVQSFGW